MALFSISADNNVTALKNSNQVTDDVLVVGSKKDFVRAAKDWPMSRLVEPGIVLLERQASMICDR